MYVVAELLISRQTVYISTDAQNTYDSIHKYIRRVYSFSPAYILAMRAHVASASRAVVILIAALVVPSVLSGCASTGAFNTLNTTEVKLAESNYEIVATNVQGEAKAGYILGVSGSAGRQLRTFALARVSGSGQLYGDALKDLWARFETENGDPAGKDLALVNVRYDVEALNLILYTRPKVSVRADVVKFTE